MDKPILLCTLLLATALGCAQLGGSDSEDLAGVSDEMSMLSAHHQVYSLKEGLDLQISFETQKAYDAVQLGLYLLCEMENRNPPVCVEDREFFPRYFALINGNIQDGLLYISEEEATRFATNTYLKYQQSVQEGVEMLDYRETHLLSEVVDR